MPRLQRVFATWAGTGPALLFALAPAVAHGQAVSAALAEDAPAADAAAPDDAVAAPDSSVGPDGNVDAPQPDNSAAIAAVPPATNAAPDVAADFVDTPHDADDSTNEPLPLQLPPRPTHKATRHADVGTAASVDGHERASSGSAAGITLPAGSAALDGASVQRVVARLVELHFLGGAAEAQDPAAFAQAIRGFQNGAGIAESGTLDRDTLGRLLAQ